MRKEKYIKAKESKNGYYFTVQFYYSTAEGKQQYSKTFNSNDFNTPGEALNAACEHRDIMRAKYITTGLPSRQRKTLDELWKDYKEFFPQSENTLTRKDSEYRFISSLYGNTDIHDVTEAMIYKTLTPLVKTKSDLVIGRVFNCWQYLFRTAKVEHLVPSATEPLEGIIVPRSQLIMEKRAQDITLDDLHTAEAYLLTHGRNADDRRNYQEVIWMLETMRYTGMRPAETYSLQKEDVDLVNMIIHVKHSQDSAGAMVKTKTEGSIRDIPIVQAIVSVLKNAIDSSLSDYVFSFPDGTNFNTKYVNDVLIKIKKATGVNIHPYMMRHLFATELDKADVSLRTRMELMGHTSETTAMMYPRSDIESKREAVRLVENGRKLS